MNLVGPYAADRAQMTVEPAGDSSASVTVTWANGAAEQAIWNMTGAFDPSTLTMTYQNGTKTVRTFGENGEVTSETTAYTNGSGSITFSQNNTLLWTDDIEHIAGGTVFTFSA